MIVCRYARYHLWLGTQGVSDLPHLQSLHGGLALPKERETTPLQDRSTAVLTGQITLSGSPGILVRMRLEWLSG